MVTKNISFFCYSISTIVSFLPAKSLFFFLIWMIYNAFYIIFLSLELNVYCGTKLVSWGMTYLSNRLRAVRQEAVFLSQIFLSDWGYFDICCSSSNQLSWGTLNGCQIVEAFPICGNYVRQMKVIPLMFRSFYTVFVPKN